MKATLSLTVVGAFLLMGAGSAPLWAEDTKPSVEERLLEVLKKNGVINDDQYTELKGMAAEMRQEETTEKATLEHEIDRYVEEAQASRAGGDMVTGFQMGYKDGFFAKSADGNYSMTIGGYVQVRYTYTDFDEDAKSGGSASLDPRLGVLARPASADTNSIDIRRGRFYVYGNVLDQYTHYFMQIETGDDASGGSGNVSLEDYFIDYTRFDPFNLKIGQFKVPFGRQELTPAYALLFQERTRATAFFTPARDGGAGAMAYGSFGGNDNSLIEYYAGVFNGEGINNGSNDGPGLLYAGRLAINPLGAYGYNEPDTDQSEDLRVTVGGGVAWDPDDNVSIGAIPLGDVDTTTFGVDAGGKWYGLSVQGEYFHANYDPAASLGPGAPGDFDAEGWYGQAGWLIPNSNFEVAGRYGRVADLDGLLSGTKNNDFNEWSVGLNYYFPKEKGDKLHRAKLQADWTRYEFDPDKGPGKSQDDLFRIQVQLMF